ncbi:MAG: sigma-54 dependent transcriptional regulator [Magnetovibrio sp.]|nr:sigma-54 dependent transcriptional regulator [Magnetovibrio sp.]
MTTRATVLVVDDEVRSLETLNRVLSEEFDVLTATNTAEAEKLLQSELVHVILCDQRMADETGVEFLCRVREAWPDPIRMIISGYSDSEDIIAGVNDAGIYRYITKPWHPDELIEIVRGAQQVLDLQKENETAALEMKLTARTLKRQVFEKKKIAKKYFHFDRIVHGQDSSLIDSINLAKRCADFDISVLITGESGTGKELLARAIHYGSGRADNPFVVENCGALPDELLESELFGCKKGAFTGAYQDRIGQFEVASGGTIFLDEIGETSPAFQVKLLRVLQEGEIRPLGAQKVRKVDVRIVAATNKNLEEEVDAGRFRGDLYYRLAAFPIHIPSLKERIVDIEPLTRHVLTEVGATFGKSVKGFSSSAIAAMKAYSWPGNVRELQNEIQRMVTLSDADVLDHTVLSEKVVAGAQQSRENVSDDEASLKGQVESLERRLITEALVRHHGNISRVADDLGLSRVGLRNKLERYGLKKVTWLGEEGHG